MSTSRLFAKTMLLPDGWASDVAVTIDATGRIESIEADSTARAGDEIAAGPVVPPLTNVHSHAFQRAMAGLAETAGPGEDTFWTWRQQMYRTVAAIDPDDAEAIATKLYVELLKGGFGRVAEFHYLHHGRDGTPYNNPAEMSLRHLAAARSAGIGITLLPAFYAHGGVGGADPEPRQRPFLHTVESFLSLVQGLEAPCREAGAILGTAIHSLRAAAPAEMRAILAAVPAHHVVHLHLAEQVGEVNDCLAWSGQRPAEWLLDHFPVDSRWCLIHSTHLTADEIDRLARSGAVAGLCPVTEANLGDGIFPAIRYRSGGGRFGVGTDSQVATSVVQELRQLEYSQRLRDLKRIRLAAGPGSSVGRGLFDAALAGGTQAGGLDSAGIATGHPADFVVLDGGDPFLATAEGDTILDRWIFGCREGAVRDVMIGGKWRIRDRRHEQDEAIDRDFGRVLRRIAG